MFSALCPDFCFPNEDTTCFLLSTYLRSSDGVRSVYAQFAKLPRLTREHAPALHDYLEEGEPRPAGQVRVLGVCVAVLCVCDVDDFSLP